MVKIIADLCLPKKIYKMAGLDKFIVVFFSVITFRQPSWVIYEHVNCVSKHTHTFPYWADETRKNKYETIVWNSLF